MLAKVYDWKSWSDGMIEIMVDKEMLGMILDHLKSEVEHNVQTEQYYEAKEVIYKYLALKEKYDSAE